MSTEFLDPQINPSDYTILIVDDNLTNVILLQAILKRERYNTLKAMNGEEALQIMQEKKPDLVLLDIMMPGMDGYETAKRKSEIESIRNIPFMFVTALSDTNSMVKGFKHGCSDFITKPFNNDEISIRIHHQLVTVANRRTIMAQSEELKSLIKNRDKLYAVVAHDLRSPLGTIKTVLRILDENVTSDMIGEDLYDLLHDTTESADELFDLLENLLCWAKAQMGKLMFNPSVFTMAEVVDDAINATSSMATVHKIKVSHNDLTNGISFTADKNMITTIVRNMIVNAVKFSEDDSKIEIESSVVDGNIKCSVRDYGCGMSEEVQNALRSQISITTTGVHQEQGSGLGLTLCREFIKAHKGTFDFISKEFEGTTFSFTFPIA